MGYIIHPSQMKGRPAHEASKFQKQLVSAQELIARDPAHGQLVRTSSNDGCETEYSSMCSASCCCAVSPALVDASVVFAFAAVRSFIPSTSANTCASSFGWMCRWNFTRPPCSSSTLTPEIGMLCTNAFSASISSGGTLNSAKYPVPYLLLMRCSPPMHLKLPPTMIPSLWHSASHSSI